jgi:nucleotide-binding universal stress UspA family protein
MSPIVVAHDFSGCARTAVRLAAALAKRRGTPLLLLHAVVPPALDLAALPVGTTPWEEDLSRSAQAEIEQEAEPLRRRGVAVETRVAFGPAARAILDLAAEVKASLIVVGTHGRKGAAHLLLGSVAERVVRAAPCPVLVTRESVGDIGRWEEGAPLRLTIAADGTTASSAAFHWTRTWAQPIAGEVSLVRLYWPPQEGARYGIDDPWQGNEGHPELVRVLDRDLRRDARGVSGAYEPSVRFRVAERDGEEGLAEDVRDLRGDALVLGIPRSIFPRGEWSPIAVNPILRSAPVPVFCVPAAMQPSHHRIAPIRSVLLACDLSDSSRAAVLPAYGLLTAGGRVEILYVHAIGTFDLMSNGPSVTPLTPAERTEIEARLRAEIPAEAAEHGITTHISLAESPTAGEAILGAAERLDTDVVAIGSHGRSGITRALLGSVAEDVARRSRRPVMIVRSHPNAH